MGEYYNKCPYLTAEARKTIGKELNLEPSQVLIRAYFDIGLVDTKGLILKGGVQGKFFWRIRFDLWSPQVPLITGETFGEVLGSRRPTVPELRHAQNMGVK